MERFTLPEPLLAVFTAALGEGAGTKVWWLAQERSFAVPAKLLEAASGSKKDAHRSLAVGRVIHATEAPRVLGGSGPLMKKSVKKKSVVLVGLARQVLEELGSTDEDLLSRVSALSVAAQALAAQLSRNSASPDSPIGLDLGDCWDSKLEALCLCCSRAVTQRWRA